MPFSRERTRRNGRSEPPIRYRRQLLDKCGVRFDHRVVGEREAQGGRIEWCRVAVTERDFSHESDLSHDGSTPGCLSYGSGACGKAHQIVAWVPLLGASYGCDVPRASRLMVAFCHQARLISVLDPVRARVLWQPLICPPYAAHTASGIIRWGYGVARRLIQTRSSVQRDSLFVCFRRR